MDIGPIIRQARESKGWSQDQLAERVGVGRPHISRLEAGAREPTVALLSKLLKVLELDPRSVFHPAA